jgi:hypothetical protein
MEREGAAMPLCIKNFKRFEKNTLRGFFDVELPSGMILCGCSLHEKEGKRWIGLPAKQYSKPDGAQSWVKIVDFADREKARQFQDIVLPAVEAAAMAEGVP